MKRLSSKQVDNSSSELKAHLRRKVLPKGARVLDLFCGHGEMYTQVYKGNAESYLGIDKNKIHDPEICLLMDNERYINQNNIDTFDVFDLDDYGCPWKLMHLIFRNRKSGTVTMYVTDGLPLKLKTGGRIPRILSATENIPRGMSIPIPYRFYTEMFGTMLRGIEMRYGWRTDLAIYAWNSGHSVCYWALKMNKRPA
jgi:hypothetical protein